MSIDAAVVLRMCVAFRANVWDKCLLSVFKLTPCPTLKSRVSEVGAQLTAYIVFPPTKEQVWNSMRTDQ